MYKQFKNGKIIQTYYGYQKLTDGFIVSHGWVKLYLNRSYCYSNIEFSRDRRLIVYAKDNNFKFHKAFIRLDEQEENRLQEQKFHFQMDREERCYNAM